MKLEITELDTPKKQTICLNMIVKNEAPIIEATLKNICANLPITFWVISDTGSTDNTKEIIQKFFTEKNIPGEIFDDKWQDFGHNRSIALKHAYNKSDYLLIFDADDSFHGTLNLPTLLTHDKYCFKFGEPGTGFAYNRPLLINNRKKFKFVGVLHEYLAMDEATDGSTCLIDGDYFIHSGKNGNRSQDADKYKKDAVILAAAFEKETEGSLKNRYAFYCAQSYRDCKNIEKSIEWYKKCLEGNNWVQEKYYSALMIGKFYLQLGDKEKALYYLLKTTQYDPYRVEGLLIACSIYRSEGMHNMVVALYEQFKDYRKHVQHLELKLFVDKGLYMGQFDQIASICACYSNKPEIGYVICRDLILHCRVGEIVVLAISNLRFYLKYFIEDHAFEMLLSIYNILSQIPLVEAHHKTTIEFITEKIKPKLNEEQSKLIKLLRDNYDNKNIVNTTKKTIAIYTGFSNISYNGMNYSDKKIGGSEIAAINIAENLAKQFNVFYTGHNIEPCIHKGVRYAPPELLRELLEKEMIDHMIVLRYVNFFTDFRNTAKKTYLWLHDTVPCPWVNGGPIHNSGYDLIHNIQNGIEKIVCLTPWHYNKVLKESRLSDDKLCIIGNGLNNTEFKGDEIRQKHRFIYASAANRSLASIVHLFPKIVEKIPDAELHIFSDAPDDIQEQIKGKNYFVYHGRVTHDQIIKEFEKSDIMLYIPNSFCETYCICALEAQRAGCLCFVSDLGSLPDVVGERGIVFKKGDNMVNIIVETLNNTSLVESKRKLMKDWAVNQSWENRSLDWLEIIGDSETSEKPAIQLVDTAEWNFKPEDEPPSVLINLDRREDRLSTFITKYYNYFTNISRFSAIDGKSFDFSPYVTLFEGNDFNYRKGVMGCALSHYKIWQKLAKTKCEDNDFILVLEDDVQLAADFQEKYKSILTDLRKDSKWDLIMLCANAFGAFGTVPNLDQGTNKINDKFTELLPIEWKNWAPGTGAYLIRKRTAIKLLSLVKDQKIKRAIDCFIMDHFNSIKTYKCEQPLAHSNIAKTGNDDSDIQNNYACYPIEQIKKESVPTD